MTDAPKYEPDDEPGLIIIQVTDQPDIDDGYLVRLSGEIWWADHADAERGRQEYALAIADRVHGPDLARLREVDRDTRALRRIDAERRVAQRVCRLGGVDFWIVRGPGIAIGEGPTLAAALFAADEDHARRTAPAFKPTLQGMGLGGVIVIWGPEPEDCTPHVNAADAAADFGERYAAWKAAQR